MSPLIPPGLRASSPSVPSFDDTLGALFIGHTLASILYGTACLQMFIYTTARRSQMDKLWLKVLVYFLFQAMMSAGVYRFVISDYLNPLALPTEGPASGEVFIYAFSLLLTFSAVIVQLFFCWRIWILSKFALATIYRVPFILLVVSLSLFSFGSNLDQSITGFKHEILTGNPPSFVLAYKLATSSTVAFDIIVTVAMSISLYNAQSTIKSTNNVVRIIIVFIVNSNLLSTVLSITEFITFMTLPHATIYGGIGFVLGKTYFNSFLAILNSREFLSDKLSQSTTLDRRELSFNPEQNVKAHSTTTKESDTAIAGFELTTADMTFSTGSNFSA